MKSISQTAAWRALQKHHKTIAKICIKDEFNQDLERAKKLSLDACGIFLDFSKNRITTKTLPLLCKLAEAANLTTHIEDMFSGAIINVTEKRAVLHTALRNPNCTPEIRSSLEHMRQCASAIRDGSWKGYSNKSITDVINIGIGGSDLGPQMVAHALLHYSQKNLKVHFVSNVDGTHIAETLKDLNPETTLFIVSSKTFTTQETLCNANTAKEWITAKYNNPAVAIKRHFVAVSAKPERAVEFGIAKENVFPFWDWVGGRFSLWSAIGLSIAIQIGMDKFEELLAGAHAMDEHFRQQPFSNNLPVILGMLGIWNTNFWKFSSNAIIPYDQYLQFFPVYLQQLEMESNGKRVNILGKKINYHSSPIVWGAVGTNGQHAFHQLFMQGTEVVPVDFILPAQTHNPLGEHHLLLIANCLAQSQALMQGKNLAEITAELKAQGLDKKEIAALAPHKVIPGNIPSNTLLIEKITPTTLGSLIALYEHKVFVQGVIWQINSFDQWGVELGKHLASQIVPKLQLTEKTADLDSSTAGLIAKLQMPSQV
jgi:glucose-6-phosphate isomerase